MSPQSWQHESWSEGHCPQSHLGTCIPSLFQLALCQRWSSDPRSARHLNLIITIDFVLLSFTDIFHFVAQLKILSISFCISVLLLPLIFPSFIQVAVSSANRLAVVLALRTTSISLIKMRNKRGDIEELCGSPSSSRKTSVLHPFTSTRVLRPLKKWRTYRINLGRNWVVTFCILDRLTTPCRILSHSRKRLP